MNWKIAKEIIASNPEVAFELEKNELKYQIIAEVIRARIEKNSTQKAFDDL